MKVRVVSIEKDWSSIAILIYKKANGEDWYYYIPAKRADNTSGCIYVCANSQSNGEDLVVAVKLP